jgi:RES domain-containing protein
MVYTSGSRALAALETLVHLRKDQLPSDYVFFVADIPDVLIEAPPTAALPPDWRDAHPLQARVFGSEWARAGRSLMLAVPSIVIPEEPNYLLNPEHPAFAHVRVTGPQVSV